MSPVLSAAGDSGRLRLILPQAESLQRLVAPEAQPESIRGKVRGRPAAARGASVLA